MIKEVHSDYSCPWFATKPWQLLEWHIFQLDFLLRDCAIIIGEKREGGGGGLKNEPHIEKYYLVSPCQRRQV